VEWISPVWPTSFEDFEDDFLSLLVSARPERVLRILRMRLRRVPPLKAGAHKGAGSSRGLEFPRGLVPLRGLNSHEDGFLREESPQGGWSFQEGWNPDDRWNCH
jgi:hypothetical protein